MKLKVITLNMWQGIHLDKVTDWLGEERPDVVMLQEAIGEGEGEFEGVAQGGFEKLKTELGMGGVYQRMVTVRDERGFYEFGVAVLSKLVFEKSTSEFYLHDHREISKLVEIRDPFPGFLLGVRVDVGGVKVEVLTTHGVWSLYPEITDQQIKAARNLKAILNTKDSFILGGDMNVTDDSEVYRIMSQGLVDDRPKGVETTLHPEVHRAKGIKLAVDFLWHKGERIRLEKSEVPMVPISDHLPIVAEYEIGGDRV